MIEPIDITEQLLFSTARIETRGKRDGVGTGFFFNLFWPPIAPNLNTSPKVVTQLIVTNRHVLRDAESVTLLFHEGRDGKPTNSSFSLSAGVDNCWVSHPNDEVDLCAAEFGMFETRARELGRSIFAVNISNLIVCPDQQLADLRAVEDVLMVGYPNGLWDEIHNLPLIRAGITSTHPAVDYRGRPETMIDLACFPGSSGSPVLIHERGMVSDKRGNIRQGHRTIFLGVLASGPTISAEAKPIAGLPPVPPVAYETQMMMHLGVVIKAKEVIALAQHAARLAGTM